MKLLIVLAFVSMISISMSCKCRMTDAKHHFCGSDFALKVEVLAEKQTTEDLNRVWFATKVVEIFKANDTMKIPIISGKIYTSASSASCGVYLKKGSTYIITGGLNNGRLNVISCGFNKEVNHLTSEEKIFFDKDYKSVVC